MNEACDMMSGSDEEEDLEIFLDVDPANFHEYEEDDEGKCDSVHRC